MVAVAAFFLWAVNAQAVRTPMLRPFPALPPPPALCFFVMMSLPGCLLVLVLLYTSSNDVRCWGPAFAVAVVAGAAVAVAGCCWFGLSMHVCVSVRSCVSVRARR